MLHFLHDYAANSKRGKIGAVLNEKKFTKHAPI